MQIVQQIFRRAALIWLEIRQPGKKIQRRVAEKDLSFGRSVIFSRPTGTVLTVSEIPEFQSNDIELQIKSDSMVLRINNKKRSAVFQAAHTQTREDAQSAPANWISVIRLPDFVLKGDLDWAVETASVI